ncbi:fimbrial protein [Serratia marcescens]|uniref:fimbrial protein n=1 Tax=Serratia marcescens TaxID=615 RepID=UPI0007C8EA26|nr:fimbrial protein [Serratia marcescens]OAH32771.1 pilin [Serratia marcescens]
MKNLRTVLVVFSCLLSPAVVQAAPAPQLAGWGRVNMQGAIIDTPCAIAVDSREQVIDMGTFPLADIVRDGEGRTRPFSIVLVDCLQQRSGLHEWKQFQVTFDGDAEGALFGVQGEASGVALAIRDRAGRRALPGQAMVPMNIVPGDMRLDYTLSLVANHQALKSGHYTSAIRFRLDYF